MLRFQVALKVVSPTDYDLVAPTGRAGVLGPIFYGGVIRVLVPSEFVEGTKALIATCATMSPPVFSVHVDTGQSQLC